ncbi:NADPH-dependent F420 reductase [Pedobacter foliorum]|uniref:NADPH-dependent F420 reductase n=1 Tax=Pedobacter foliorum TaxID=2739058 RepID=UPI001563AB72|nr:NAD(P)-binding domain-containing protein [Pedobacter foliorum]NRF39616.1 NAD(P)-binding domain-containing protein [Pedobacter foliorum]
MKKTIGIIGAGNIGQTVARHLLKAGHPVMLSNSSGPDTLKDIISALGEAASATTVEEAVKANIVLLSLPWSQVPTLTKITDWNNRIVIDATNHFISYAPDFEVQDLGGRASSEVVAELLPGARVVKAFNTIFFKILAADPKVAGGNRVLFISGDDKPAKTEIADIITSIGFAPIDLGSLNEGSKLQQAKGPLATLNLVKM